MNKTRLKTNAINTASNIAYYGGTLGAGAGFYQLLNKPSALGIVTVLVFTLTVEGLIRTLLDEVVDAVIRRHDTDPTTATTGTTITPKETSR
ncbi:hypothetical protein AB0F30_16875 [Streptomyces sp. NPDC029006]|uniref:hypothetical protein n=1 Tax=Streptomyces sp. NPDC029006 TaxID=3155467 RepID=UPI0033C6811C